MTIDWSKAPANAEAASEGLTEQYHAWYRRDLYGRVFQICPSAGCEDWTSMGGRTDFPVGSVLRPVKEWAATVQQANGWDGEGLPPVGTVCEYRTTDAGEYWCEANVKYVGTHWILVGYEHPTEGLAEAGINHVKLSGDVSKFLRQVRTAEQIAADEKSKAISEILSAIGWDPEAKGAREAAERVFSAGYRKQEKPCGF